MTHRKISRYGEDLATIIETVASEIGSDLDEAWANFNEAEEVMGKVRAILEAKDAPKKRKPARQILDSGGRTAGNEGAP